MLITETKLKEIISSALRQVLMEDKRGKQAKAKSLQVIREFFNNASWLDTEFVHQDNPNHLSHIDYMLQQFENEFYHDPNLRASAAMRLEPLFVKLAFDCGFQQANPDGVKLQRLQHILRFMYELARIGKLDLSKIGLDTTYEDLEQQYGKEIDRMEQDEEERIGSKQYERNTDYEIIGPVDYATAHKYGEKTCPESKLCYTQSESTWTQYTQDGQNKVYILLRNGWENVPPLHDDDNESAYDTYGLSMIFVFINKIGKLVYCNTRWNHKAEYDEGFSVDHAMNKEMISDLIGQPFNEVFGVSGKYDIIGKKVKINGIEGYVLEVDNAGKPTVLCSEILGKMSWYDAMKTANQGPWHLPTVEEWKKYYEVVRELDGDWFFYWTSTEYNSLHARCVVTGNGDVPNGTKAGSAYVRAFAVL